jgi:hypothetical protein
MTTTPAPSLLTRADIAALHEADLVRLHLGEGVCSITAQISRSKKGRSAAEHTRRERRLYPEIGEVNIRRRMIGVMFTIWSIDQDGDGTGTAQNLNALASRGFATWDVNHEWNTLRNVLMPGMALRLDWRVTASSPLREAGLELHETAVTIMRCLDPAAVDAELGTYRLPPVVYHADNNHRMIRTA